MDRVEVSCSVTAGGWICLVTVGDRRLTPHRVSVSASDLERLSPGARDPEALVAASFAFLLEREPDTSILREFDLPLIGRYFPEYEREIGRRVGR